MTKKQVNESIRIAKEGIGECWDDMAGMTGQTPEGQGEGPMTVTINMPGKNISVTTDSADEIANILKLAGIQVGGMSADAAMPTEMPGELAGVEEPAVMYVGAEPTVAGDNDGDGDHDMTDHDIEHQDHEDSESEEEEADEDEDEEVAKEGNEFSGALASAKAEGKDEFEVSGKKYKVDGSGVEEAAGDKSYTSKGGTVTQTATGLTHQAGSGTYGGTETDAEEKARKDAEQEMAKKELPEATSEEKNEDEDGRHDLPMPHGEYDDEVNEAIRILQLAGVTNEAQSAAQKAAFAKMIASKGGNKSDDKADSKDDNKKPDADGDGVPDWADKKDGKEVKEEAPATNSIFGQGVYEQSYARILALAGLEESKLANSPEGTSMDEPKVFDSLPSAPGTGAGNKAYGANRANGQGENPMGLEESTVEQKFEDAMGEYRKFVAESVSRKK